MIDAACQDGTSTQVITMVLDIVNNASTALPLSQVTLRYWFKPEAVTDALVLSVDYATIPAASVASKFVTVSPARVGANAYLEIGFAPTAPTLALFSDSGQIQLRIQTAGFTTLDSNQVGDYSFQNCGTAQSPNQPPYNPAPTITGYIDGVLAFGSEPG
ncbi:MAG TPA: cellulose binding domain-containing protein [Polyangia bacterium]|nr:cellulose binding domain-containing protein [Polyangia bacterium]